MRATLWFWITIALTVLWMTEPAIAGHSTKKKGAKRRASARLQRNTQGKQLALELLSSQASPTLQTLAGLHEGQILDGDDADEVAREDDVPVDIATIRTLWMAYVDGEQPPSGLSQRQVMEFIMDWLGRPYRFGGSSADGIDCSAFIQTLFRTCAAALLPRTAQEQYAYGQQVQHIEDLQFGDLVFFHTRSHAWVSHVGIYLGDRLFAHASSRYGVTISSLESTYYHKRFIGGRRLTLSDLQQLALRSEVR
ncbi:Murein DD-endopeptidase MepS/Murein LD-carboxypeptidase [bacterium HR20]|nr:Murein DD-endopeptidase MepS/Murein LD-carboxypeptidase [bacterium HR20]